MGGKVSGPWICQRTLPIPSGESTDYRSLQISSPESRCVSAAMKCGPWPIAHGTVDFSSQMIIFCRSCLRPMHLFKPLDCPTSNAPCPCKYQQLSMSEKADSARMLFTTVRLAEHALVWELV